MHTLKHVWHNISIFVYEYMSYTQAPDELDFEFGVHVIKRQAEAHSIRSREVCTNSHIFTHTSTHNAQTHAYSHTYSPAAEEIRTHPHTPTHIILQQRGIPK